MPQQAQQVFKFSLIQLFPNTTIRFKKNTSKINKREKGNSGLMWVIGGLMGG
jgi:hypothetical protein